MPDVQVGGRGGGVAAAAGPVPAGGRGAAAAAAAAGGRAGGLRGTARRRHARRLPGARARDWPAQRYILRLLQICRLQGTYSSILSYPRSITAVLSYLRCTLRTPQTLLKVRHSHYVCRT